MLNLFNIMFNVIAPIFIVLGITFFIGKRFKPDPRSLSPFIIYLFGPALVFKGIYQTELSGGELGRIGIMVIGVGITMMILATLTARLLNFKQRAASSLTLAVILANAGNYGIPLNTFAFGEDGGNVAIVYFAVSAMMGNILGVYFASRGTFKVRDSLLNVLKVPLAYAAILGLIFNVYNIELPLIIERSVIDIASGASIPLMLALLGLHLSRVSFKQNEKNKNDTQEETLASDIRAIAAGVGLKLLIAPFIAFGFAMVLGLQGTVLSVAIVQSSMPTAVFATALATEFGGDAPYVTAVTIIGTLTSIITLTVLLFVLGGVAI